MPSVCAGGRARERATGLFHVHPLSPKHLGKIDRRVDIEIHLFPVVEHLADVVVALGFKHVDIRRLRPQRPIERHSLQSSWTVTFVPPFARFGHHIRVLEDGPWFVFDKRDVEHIPPSFGSDWDRSIYLGPLELRAKLGIGIAARVTMLTVPREPRSR